MRAMLIAGLAIFLVVVMMPPQKAQGETLMQCMEKCIQYEGGNSATNKATCKNRCGAAAVKNQSGGKRDCMGEFKICNQKCGKEKIGQPSPCHKQCKAGLRTCK